MRTETIRNTALGMLAAFILGALIGYSFTPGDDSKPSERRKPRALPQAGSERVEQPQDGGAAPETRSDSEQAAFKLFAESLAGIPAQEVQTGTGTVSGHVLTDAGTPLAGVLVQAIIQPESKATQPGDGETEATGEEQVLEFLSYLRRERATRREARTDENGKYALTGLVDGARYTLMATHDEFLVEDSKRDTRHYAKAGDTVDFIARLAGLVPVLVLMPDGRPADYAKISCYRTTVRGRYGTSEYWTRAEPVLKLLPGSYTLTAESCEDEESTSEPFSLEVEAGKTAPEVTLQLKGRRGIKGRVMFTGGEEVPAVAVFALRYVPGSVPLPERLVREGRQEHVRFEWKLSYCFNDLVAGHYLLGVTCGNSKRVLLTMTVQVRDEMLEQDLMLPPLAPSEYRILYVYAPDGQVVSDIIAFGAITPKGARRGGSDFFGRRRDGSFLVLISSLFEDDAETDMPGSMSIEVTSSSYGVAKVGFAPADSSPIIIRFKEPAELEVSLTGYVGSGHEGAFVLSLDEKREDNATATRLRGLYFWRDDAPRIDANGHARFAPIQPGEYEAILGVKHERFGGYEVGRVPVSVTSGRNTLTVQVPALHTLTIMVDNPEPKANLYISSENHTISISRELPGGTGTATFEHLPAGKYRVNFQDSEHHGWMTVTLPGPQVVRFQSEH